MAAKYRVVRECEVDEGFRRELVNDLEYQL